MKLINDNGKIKIFTNGITIMFKNIDKVEYSNDEHSQIRKLLEKKHYEGQGKDTVEFRKTYHYLLRRGFKSSDILKEMSRFEQEFY